MFDLTGLKDLASAKKKVQDKRAETAGSAFENALTILEEFEENPDRDLLQNAADKLIESLQFSPDHSPSYVCLAYIFYILYEDEFALKYINIAESYYPEELPLPIQEFKQKIKENIPWAKKEM